MITITNAAHEHERSVVSAPPSPPRRRAALRLFPALLLLLLLLPAPCRAADNLKFCGVTLGEARSFCHVPDPAQSLPCPGGPDDCPYSMPCWELDAPCTAPPSAAPTAAPVTRAPTASPLTARSTNPGDHHFCGVGFDNLFGW